MWGSRARVDLHISHRDDYMRSILILRTGMWAIIASVAATPALAQRSTTRGFHIGAHLQGASLTVEDDDPVALAELLHAQHHRVVAVELSAVSGSGGHPVILPSGYDIP